MRVEDRANRNVDPALPSVQADTEGKRFALEGEFAVDFEVAAVRGRA